jgi:hypothetical protein
LGCWDMPVWLACQNILCLHHLLPFLFLKNTCFIFFLPHPPRISPWYLHIIHMSYIYIYFLNSFIQSLSQSGSHSFINSFIQILWFMYIYNYIHKPASNHLFVARDLIWVLPSRQPWIQQPLLINDGFSGFPQIVILWFSNSTCFIEQCHKMMPKSSKMLQVGLYFI